MELIQQLASSSTKILIHDASKAKSSHFNTAQSAGIGLQPLIKFPQNSHIQGSEIYALSWSHNNQIVASGANDGQIVLSNATNGAKVQTIMANENEIIQGGTQYVMGTPAVNSLVFSKHSEFIFAGMADGITKAWNLQKKAMLAARIIPSVHQKFGPEQQLSSISSVTLNCNNQILATSNYKGIINLYKTDQLFYPLDTPQNDQVINMKQYAQINGDQSQAGAINQSCFSNLMKETLGTATEHGSVFLYNVTTQQQIGHFNKHNGQVKGLSFSPLNKLLMCSVGLDRLIYFYDIHDKIIVKKIQAPFPIKSVNFSSDGHTLAVGSSINGQNQQCLIYDLRKSSSVTLPLIGHESAVNCIRFTQKFDQKKQQNYTQVGAQIQNNKPLNVLKHQQIIKEDYSKQLISNIEEKNKQKQQKSNVNLENLPADQSVKPQKTQLSQKLKQRFDYDGDVKMEELENHSNHSNDEKGISQIEIKDYIDQQLDIKLGNLQNEVFDMIDSYQIEVIRQFQIQQQNIDFMIKNN